MLGEVCVLPTAPVTRTRSSVPRRDAALLISFFPPPTWARSSGSTSAYKSSRACTFSGQCLELQEDCPPEELGLSQDQCQCHRSVGGWSVNADGTAPSRWALPGRCGGFGVGQTLASGQLVPRSPLPRSAASPAPGTHRPGLPQASPRARRQEAHGRSL